MTWKMLEKPKTVLASRSIVKEFCDMDPIPRDRPLSERRLVVYHRILKAGGFRPVVWASALCKETGTTYRVNGKHTSTMLSGFDPLPEFYITIERWICDTLSDVASLYGTYDSRLATRTANDINLSFASTISDLHDIKPRYVNLTVSAACYLKWDEAIRDRIPPAERAEELIERADFCLWLKKICTDDKNKLAPAKHLLRSPVVCAMMTTYDRSSTRGASTEFWSMVRDEASPNRECPTRELARYLTRVVMVSSRGAGLGKKPAGHREVFVKCIHAWNAWRKGEKTALKYHAGADIPSVSK